MQAILVGGAYVEQSRYIAEMVERHERDLYRGNGLPGLTTRIKTVEDKQMDYEKAQAIRDNKVTTRLNLLIGAAFSLAGAIVFYMLFKH
jgi:hypothetical protein